jgi:hypothetical protein
MLEGSSMTITTRAHVPTIIAAAAIAVGGIWTATAVAIAQPESDIKSECADSGGRYTTTTADGHTTSSCCYENIFGITHCDVFKDGEISDGDSFNQPPTKTKPPVTMSKVPPPARQ